MAHLKGMCSRLQVLVLLSVLTCVMAQKLNTTQRCWKQNDCVIQLAFLSEKSEENAFATWWDPVPPSKCFESLSELISQLTEEYHSIILDGSFCPQKMAFTAYEIGKFPNCHGITEIVVKRINGTLDFITCALPEEIAVDMQLEAISFIDNEVTTIKRDAFKNLPNLKRIIISKNRLTHMDGEVFQSSPVISLRISDEPKLSLMEPELFDKTHLESIELVRLLRLSNKIFKLLPVSLENLLITETIVEPDMAELENLPPNLRNLTITKCHLRSFTLVYSASRIALLNLSGNALQYFNVTAVSVEVLDLSTNALEQLGTHWLDSFTNLKQLLLGDNRLYTLSFEQVLVSASMEFIDLRNNSMTHFQEHSHQRPLNSKCRIRVDHNPWNCLWVLEFAQTYPEKFRIFQYDKYISRINVNGLECQSLPAVEKADLPISLPTTKRPLTQLQPGNGSQFLNVSTYTLAFGSVTKRNQRAEAIIIVFMLPLGIAFLFVVLYMYIYCERIFHLSYYYGCGAPSCCPGSTKTTPRTEYRCDVVRQFPQGYTNNGGLPVDDDGYEVPVNADPDVCNCACNGSSIHKCQNRNVTYVPLPSEQPCKIYEEIIGDGL